MRTKKLLADCQRRLMRHDILVDHKYASMDSLMNAAVKSGPLAQPGVGGNSGTGPLQPASFSHPTSDSRNQQLQQYYSVQNYAQQQIEAHQQMKMDASTLSLSASMVGNMQTTPAANNSGSVASVGSAPQFDGGDVAPEDISQSMLSTPSLPDGQSLNYSQQQQQQQQSHYKVG